MYTEKELKEATQIAYLSFLTDAKSNLKADGITGSFPLRELIRSSFNVQGALKAALEDGISEKDITTKILVQYSDLKDSDKAIIEDFSEDMLDWKVVDIQDKNSLTGFYACCIETSDKDAIIAFRGSENMKKYSNMVNDWMRADFGLLNSRSTRQHEESEQYGEYLLEKGLLDKYDSLAITGHSLGGNLATHFTISSATEEKKELFDKIKQSINFDGPGFSDEYLDEHNEKIKKSAHKLTHLKWSAVGTLLFDVPGEHSEFLGINEDLYDDDIKEKIKYKLITRHSTKSLLFDENGTAKRGKQDFVSKGLSAFSKTVDKVIPEHLTTELFAAADWIFERILRVKEQRSLDFRDVSWAERFAQKGSLLGKCVNFINKTIDILEEGAIALGNELFKPLPNNLTLKPALADVYGGIENDTAFNLTSLNGAITSLNLKSKDNSNKDYLER